MEGTAGGSWYGIVEVRELSIGIVGTNALNAWIEFPPYGFAVVSVRCGSSGE